MIGQVDDGPAEVPTVFAADIDCLYVDAEVIRLAARIAASRQHHHLVAILLVSQFLRHIVALVFADRHSRRIFHDDRRTEVASFFLVFAEGILAAAPVDSHIHLERVRLMPTRIVRFGTVVGTHHADTLAPVDPAKPPAFILAQRKFVTERISVRRAEIVRHHEIGRSRFLVAVELHHERVQIVLRLVIDTHGRIVIVKNAALAVFRREQPRRSRIDMRPLGSCRCRIVEFVQCFLVGVDNRIQVLQVIATVELKRLGIVEVHSQGGSGFHAEMFRRRLVVKAEAILQQVIRSEFPGILHVGHMVEWLLDIGDTDGRHRFLVTFVIVFQFVTQCQRMVRNATVIQPLLAGEGIQIHFNRHEFADFHGLIEFTEGKRRVVIPVPVKAVVNAERNGNVSPIHIERVETQAVLADVIAELEARILGEIIHHGPLQVREFIIQAQVKKTDVVTKVKHIADVSGAARINPAHGSLMAFGMDLCSESADFDARLAEPFVDRILAACAAIHLEDGTQTVAVLRRETALIKLHIVYAFDQKGAEQSKKMQRRIDHRIVEQEKVLVGGTAAHINLGTEIGTCDYTRKRLDTLDDIRFGKPRHTLDGLRGNHGFAGFALRTATQLYHHFLEFGHAGIVTFCEERSDIDILFGTVR